MKAKKVWQILDKYSSEKRGDYTIFSASSLCKAVNVIAEESEYPAIYKVFDDLRPEYILEEIARYHAIWEEGKMK